jgi:hypothetical protein
VHLSNQQVLQALRNIKKSGSKYLLTTLHAETKINRDIGPGDWRPLNLMREPFNLGEPLFIFNEGFEKDKSLAMWNIADLNL